MATRHSCPISRRQQQTTETKSENMRIPLLAQSLFGLFIGAVFYQFSNSGN